MILVISVASMTPAAAIRSGSDYLVIGRPITQAENQLKCFVQLMHQ